MQPWALLPSDEIHGLYFSNILSMNKLESVKDGDQWNTAIHLALKGIRMWKLEFSRNSEEQQNRNQTNPTVLYLRIPNPHREKSIHREITLQSHVNLDLFCATEQLNCSLSPAHFLSF